MAALLIPVCMSMHEHTLSFHSSRSIYPSISFHPLSTSLRPPKKLNLITNGGSATLPPPLLLQRSRNNFCIPPAGSRFSNKRSRTERSPDTHSGAAGYEFRVSEQNVCCANPPFQCSYCVLVGACVIYTHPFIRVGLPAQVGQGRHGIQ